MEEEKVLSNLDEERETSAIDGELRAVMAEFMVGVLKFEELVEVGNKFLIRFRQALEILRRPSIYESSELVKNILKENETKRVNAYIEAGCTNAYDGAQSVTQLNTCITELQNCLTKAKGIVNELENLMEKAGNALCMNSNDQSEKSLQGYVISKTSEKLDAAGCASFMSVIYSMVKQDYMMQERIVSSLNLKLGGELESYCLLWTLRPFIDDDVIHLALRQPELEYQHMRQRYYSKLQH